MPLIEKYTYRPGLLLRNGHINTIAAYMWRQPIVPGFDRERISTPDGDFLDLDFLRSGNRKLAILLHGLEGSTSSQYIQGMAPLLPSHGFDVLALNHRSCSGEINLKRHFYHSGYIDDFEFLLEKYGQDYDEIVGIGYSLGGNVVLRYAGLKGQNVHPKLSKVIAVSAPCDLLGSSQSLLKFSNIAYSQNFLKTLKSKILAKAQIVADMPVEDLKKVKTLWDFDEYFTAPLHGFRDAMDYYKTCSSLRVLANIQMPAFLISSQDDPFLSPSCLPFKQASYHPYFSFLPQKYGGHVGFMMSKKESFADKTILSLLTSARVEARP